MSVPEDARAFEATKAPTPMHVFYCTVVCSTPTHTYLYPSQKHRIHAFSRNALEI